MVEIEKCLLLHPALQDMQKYFKTNYTGDLKQKGEIEAVIDPENQIDFLLDGKKTKDVPVLNMQVLGKSFPLGAEVFFQCNRSLIDAFTKQVIAGAKGKTAVDLYSGVGLFSAFLSDSFDSVWAVEENSSVKKYFYKNPTRPNIRFCNQSVEDWLKAATLEKIDFLVADPPRAGLSKAAWKGILTLAPAQIAYVSCNPSTLGRDLRILLEHHYKIDSISFADMFPQTFHIETIVKLSRFSS